MADQIQTSGSEVYGGHHESTRTMSRTSRRDSARHEAKSLEGKHFDNSSMVKIGQYKYPSAVFPLRRADLALVTGYAASLPPESVVGMIAGDTNRAMNPERSLAPLGDGDYDLRGYRKIKTSDIYPIVSEDILQLSFVAIKVGYVNEEGEDQPVYIDLFKDQEYAKVPSKFYLIKDLGGGRFVGEPFSDAGVLISNRPKTLGEVIQTAKGLGKWELPSGENIDIEQLVQTHPIIKVHIQILTHIKYSDNENRISVGYSSKIKVEDLSTDPEEEEALANAKSVGDFFGISGDAETQKTFGNFTAKADAGNNSIVEDGVVVAHVEIDPHAETQKIILEDAAKVKDATEQLPLSDQQIEEVPADPAGGNGTYNDKSQSTIDTEDIWALLEKVPVMDCQEELRKAEETAKKKRRQSSVRRNGSSRGTKFEF